MKILVPTKRVPDTDQKIVANEDGGRVVVDHIPYVINPFDAIALEEAVRISELPGDAIRMLGRRLRKGQVFVDFYNNASSLRLVDRFEK